MSVDTGRGQHCTTPHLTEAEIQQAFINTINSVLRHKASIVAACREAIDVLSDTTGLESERAKAKVENNLLLDAMRDMVRDNARNAQDQVEYDEKYAALTKQYEDAAARLKTIDGRLLERRAQCDKLCAFIETLDEQSPITAFDESLWNATVETVTVKKGGTLIFHWKDGSETTH